MRQPIKSCICKWDMSCSPKQYYQNSRNTATMDDEPTVPLYFKCFRFLGTGSARSEAALVQVRNGPIFKYFLKLTCSGS